MISRPAYRAIMILALGLMASGIFVMVSVPVSGPDAVQYDRLGYNLASGRGFSLSEKAPFVPTMFRDPAYPVFLAVMYRIFGHCTEAVLFVQMAMHAITALLAYYIARDIFSEHAALISGIAVALFPTLANTSAYIISETMFTLILCLGTYFFLKSVKKNAILLFVLSGVLFGLLAMTKSMAVFLPFLLAVTALFIEVIKKRAYARLLIGLTLFILMFSLTVSTWCIRNKILFNTLSLTVRSGEVLWSRAAKQEYLPKKILATACYNFSEFLGGKLFPDAEYKPERYLYQDLDKAAGLRASYRESGLTEPQADALLKKEAMEKIARRPLKYLSYTFIESIKMTAFTYLPLLNEPGITGYFDRIEKGRLLLSVLKGAMRLLALPLLVLSLMGILKNRASWDRWLPVFIIVLYVNVICSLLDAVGRYGVPLIPFYCMFAAAAFYKCIPNSKEGSAA